MSKPSHSRSKSASDVRRTLFRSLSRSGAPSSSSTNLATNIPSASSVAQPSSLQEDDEARIASEGIVVRNKDGSMDLEVPLTTSQHAQLLDGIGRELAEQQRAAAELVKRHQVDAYKRLPELLRLQVLSLSQDSWMFEPDEEC